MYWKVNNCWDGSTPQSRYLASAVNNVFSEVLAADKRMLGRCSISPSTTYNPLAVPFRRLVFVWETEK